MCIYIYIYMCTYTCVYIYIYIYIERERAIKRERERCLVISITWALQGVVLHHREGDQEGRDELLNGDGQHAVMLSIM